MKTKLNKLKHLALFNGIGGFQLAAHWMGWQNVAHVEIDEWCNRVVKKHFPKSICHTDIKQFDGTQYTNRIDILTGGFPCQPFSVAGQRKGKEDTRHLWSEMFRVIKEIRPPWIVGENVTGIIGLALEQVLFDLESAGYNTETFIIPACAVGALHKRDRLWIVAHANRKRWEDEQEKNGKSIRYGKRNDKTKEQSREFEQCGTSQPSAILSDPESIGREQPWNTRQRRAGFENGSSNDGRALSDTNCSRELQQEGGKQKFGQRTGNFCKTVSDTNGSGREELNTTAISEGQGFNTRNAFDGRSYWQTEPAVGRVANGVPNRVDRIRGLGNAIVPQVAFEIFKAIQYVNTTR